MSRPDLVAVEQDGKIVAEVDLGSDDKVVLMYDRLIDDTTADRIKSVLLGVLSTPGRQVILLQRGMTMAVLHTPRLAGSMLADEHGAAAPSH